MRRKARGVARGGDSRIRTEVRGRLRAHDPFELIRWLALSQPDPRKALAELVQNSLDAGAKGIRVVRLRERGVPCLSVWDDGEGIIPEMGRTEALRFIATHIGHSRKRSLTPEERHRLMMQGQYGIGLLGFWSLGEMLEMRTSVPGERPYRLVLYRDRPEFRVEPLRGRLPLDERWTEVVVRGLHREAMGVLAGRRAADYLASELRGQLLAREVDLVVEDRMARGRAQKVSRVRPPQFLGERVEGLTTAEVPGHPPIRLEIYLAGTDAQGLKLYCSGTLVADGFQELAPLGLDHPPWTDARLSGLVDFPGLRVTPGSRRGPVPDEAAGEFARALVSIEPALCVILESLERRKAEELDRAMIRDLQRAFREFYRQRPRYSMLPVSGPTGKGAGAGKGDEPAGGPETEGPATGEGAVAEGEPAPAPERRPVPADLLPPGPLASVRLTPSPIRVECGGKRRARAIGQDAVGKPVDAPVQYAWELQGPVGTLVECEDPGTIVLQAAREPGEGSLRVTARSAGREASADAAVAVLEEIPAGRDDEGIPEPDLIAEPGAPWRSRMQDGRWQVNVAHRDYRGASTQPGTKLRYFAMLFAKEVVLRSSHDPRLEKPLEQLVEVAAFADRSIAARRPGRRNRPTEGTAQPGEER